MDYFVRDLSDVIKVDKKISLMTALQVTRKLNIALKVLKSSGIVHLDLKPDNVLIDKDNNP